MGHSKALVCFLSCWMTMVGGSISPRIIGGSVASREDYVDAIVLISDRLDKLVCGGTLISPTLVLTAGHCAEGILENAMIGRYNRANPFERYEKIPIITEYLHPEYDADSLNYDLLLLELEYAPTSDVDYMRLNDADDMPPVGSTLSAFGWGETQVDGSDPGGAQILQAADLEIVGNRQCERKESNVESYSGKISDNMICTFSPTADHCFGDSGGPLLALSGSNATQVAVISWGADNCADGVFPGVGQRVSTSYEWISQRVCSIDGQSHDATKARYGCEDGQTFSPMPSPAPAAPTVSPAPTVFTIRVWIQLFMDEYPEDIRWILFDKVQGVPVASSPSYLGSFDDVVIEVIDVEPGRTYDFLITDSFGDGFADGGYYELSVGPDLETSELIASTNFEAMRKETFTTPIQTPAPVFPTLQPSSAPTTLPSVTPSARPSARPSDLPSPSPTIQPTESPSVRPSNEPTVLPSHTPSSEPTGTPSSPPTVTKSNMPSIQQSQSPTPAPTENTANPQSDVEDFLDGLFEPEDGSSSFFDSLNMTDVPSGMPSLEPTENSTATNAPTSFDSEICFSFGAFCTAPGQCCSQRCTLNSCQKSNPGKMKTSVAAETRGGAGSGSVIQIYEERKPRSLRSAVRGVP